MEVSDYRVNAYKKNSVRGEQAQSAAEGFVTSAEYAAHEPVIRKPVFRKVDAQVGEILGQPAATRRQQAAQQPLVTRQPQAVQQPQVSQQTQAAGQATRAWQPAKLSGPQVTTVADAQARIAAATGTWFEKKRSASTEDVKEAAKSLTSGGLIMVPGAPKDGEKESIYRRVAKFLVVIGIDEAAKILPHLTEEQTEKIIPEIATIQHVSKEESEAVLAEFSALLQKAREEGGLDTARSILTKAYGSQKAEELIERSVPDAQGKPFDFLEDANSERIRILLHGESEAVQALVLSQLEPKKAADVISAMDDDLKRAVVLRLAKLKPVSPDIMENIGKSLHDKMLTQNTENSQNLDGKGVLAQILRRMDPLAEEGIIKTISYQDPELGADLRQKLFTEEDVIGSDDRYMQNLLHSMEDGEVALLIAGKNAEFRKKILSNVSRSRGTAIREEEQLRLPVRKSDSERVTSEFYAKLRRAWEDGTLYVRNRDDGEVYV